MHVRSEFVTKRLGTRNFPFHCPEKSKIRGSTNEYLKLNRIRRVNEEDVLDNGRFLK